METLYQGQKFIIKTDQQSLRYLLDQRVVTPLQQKWITKLLGLHYDIQYKKGTENGAADALSRKQDAMEDCNALTTVTPTWFEQVVQSYFTDVFFQRIIAAKTIDGSSYPDFILIDGILQFKGRIAVGDSLGLRKLIFIAMHSSAYGGHSGVHGTYLRIKRTFYWPKLKKDIEDWVKACDVCARSKSDSSLYPGLLQPLPIPTQAWSHISMDFIKRLPKSWGKM